MLLLAALVAVAQCTWHPTAQYDRACTVDNRAFTGIRIQYERSVQLYPVAYKEKQLVITNCDQGSVAYEFDLPSNTSLFNRDIRVPGQSEVLRFARRSAYQLSDRLSYLPQTLLGAAYSRNADADATDWTPLSPLVADHWGTEYWTSAVRDGKRDLALRTSLLRSPDVLEKNYPWNNDWTALISPYEESLGSLDAVQPPN